MRWKILTLFLTGILIFAAVAGCGNGGTEGNGEEPFDATKLPFYVEDTAKLNYEYTEKQRVQPYWQGNVIYNEQLMIVNKNGVTEGRLLYNALRVLSVRDWTLKKEFKPGADYEIEGNKITLPAGSEIPVFYDEWSRGENVPPQYPAGNAGTGYQMIGDDGSVMYTETGLIYQRYVHVTYVYDPAEVNRTNMKAYTEGELLGLKEKIKNKDHLKMVVFGDSISEGHSSSGLWAHEPFSPPYAELVKQGLALYGDVGVTYENISVGGKDSYWASSKDQLQQISKLMPDFLIIGFGTNDQYDDLESGFFKLNIEKVIETAKAVNGECQIILLAPFPSNEKVKDAQSHRLICSQLKSIAEETEYLDVAYVSLYEACLDMLNVKNYYEIAGNNANHPNDFIHRFYAMNLLSAIFSF